MLYKNESYQNIKNLALWKQEKQNGTIWEHDSLKKLDFMLYKHESYQIIINLALSKQKKQNGTIWEHDSWKKIWFYVV